MMARWLAGFCCAASYTTLAISCSLLQACAYLPDAKVNLDPSPTTASAAGAQREVVVFPALDQRATKRSCGARRNEYGADVGSVRCSEPIPWLNEAILRGLNSRKFQIVTLANAKSKTPLQVNLTLETLFVDEVMEGDLAEILADVEVHVAVSSSSGLLAKRSFFVRRRERELHEGVYQDTLLLASRELATKVLDAIVELANQYPSLGKVEQPVAVWSQN